MDGVGVSVFAAVVVASLTYFLTNAAMAPVIALRQSIGNADAALVFYANIYSNPGTADSEMEFDTSRELRRIAADLRSKAHAVPFYRPAQCVGILPSRRNVVRASQELIGLSNSLGQRESSPRDNVKQSDKIRSLLGLPA